MLATAERKPLGTLLINRGIIAAAQLERALHQQRETGKKKLLGEILVDQKACSEEQIASSLAAAYGIPFARVGPRLADPAAVAVLPYEFLCRKNVLPLFLVENVLTVAVAEPANLFLVDELACRSGHAVQIVAATAREIRATLEVYLPAEKAFVVDDLPASGNETLVFASAANSSSKSKVDPSVARLVESTLQNALKLRATEVHIEPGRASLRIRFRVDGRLVEHHRPPYRLYQAVAEHFKQLCGMNPSDCTIPQIGQLRATLGERAYALHASTLPTAGAEKILLRIAHEEMPGPLKLEKLGFNYETLKQWRRLIAANAGFVFVTGPAESGKRTLLYSSLLERNAIDANLCSVESTIERSIEGVNQIPASGTGSMKYADAVRAALSHRPDVLAISDLRDADTAQLAIDAALSGTLVFAAIEAPDAAMALWRLTQLGIDRSMLACALMGVLSRRLVRKLCSSCRESHEATSAEGRILQPEPGRKLSLYSPRGCERCNHLGYNGRIGIHELLLVDDALRQRLSGELSLPDLREATRLQTPRPLRSDGLDKVRAGITTLSEMLRATM
ncbi:MAG TPA: GspE/PulE family protein [Tepidisphaeraceae bacterium]|nr:GspE/PulE family protein [Tepidisphaeraceae bacterium]